MKKLLAAIVIILVLLGLAGGAAYHYLSKGGGLSLRISASPPKDPPRGEEDYPQAESSILSVKLDLPISTIEAEANKNVPQDISGVEQKDFHQMIKNGTVQYRIVPDAIKLQNSGRNLTFRLPIQGVARVSGQVDAQIVSFPIDSTANLGGHIHGTVTPQINQDWQLIPNLDPYLDLTQADVTLGRIGTISARDIIEKAAEPLIRKELAGLSQSIDLKEHIRKVWDQLHLNQQVNEDPPVFAVVDPYAISLAPIDYSNAYNLSVTLSIEANTFLSSHPGEGIYPEPLPGLKLITYNPANLLQIPVVADVEMLNSKMADQSFSETGSNGSAISVNEFELRIGQDGYVILGCHLIANSGGKVDKTISGRIWIQAKPQLDATNQLLTFSSIELTKETRAAIPKTARIMLESQLVASLTKQLKIDLKKYMPDLESEIQKKIITQEVPEGIDLIVGKPTIKLLRIYTVTRPAQGAPDAPAIVILAGVRGDITARVSEIK